MATREASVFCWVEEDMCIWDYSVLIEETHELVQHATFTITKFGNYGPVITARAPQIWETDYGNIKIRNPANGRSIVVYFVGDACHPDFLARLYTGIARYLDLRQTPMIWNQFGESNES
jgi:hypothetical protein